MKIQEVSDSVDKQIIECHCLPCEREILICYTGGNFAIQLLKFCHLEG